MRRKPVLAALLALIVVSVAGCGSSSSNTTSTQATTGGQASTPAASAPASVASVVALLPASVKSKGTLIVAADASYPPDEFFAADGKTVIGWDADLSKALAGVMGLKASVVNVPFASILTGLSSGKYDMGASSFTDTKAREKAVDFVDYFSVGEAFFTRSAGGVTITSLAQLCGHTVAVETGTTEESDAQTQAAKCKKNHQAAVHVLSFQDQNGANLALSSARAQLGFADAQVAAYFVSKSGGAFKLVGSAFGFAPYGLALPKQPGLAKAVLAALQELVKNGTYASILKQWHVSVGATTPKLDGATS